MHTIEFSKRRDQALGIILLCLNHSIQPSYSKIKTPLALLKQLKKDFHPPQAGRLLATSSQFFSVIMEPHDTLTTYFTRVERLAAELNSNKSYAVGQGNILGVLLQGLRPEYHTICTILQMNNQLKLKDAKLKLHVFKVKPPNERSTWYLDSGASCHMTCQHGWLHNFHPIMPQVITLRDNSQISAVSLGTIIANNKYHSCRIRVKLQDILYVPKLKKNLISMSQLVSQHQVEIDSTGCTLHDHHDGSMCLYTQPLLNLLKAHLIILTIPAHALYTTSKLLLQLLHHWFGHISAKHVLQAAAHLGFNVNGKVLQLCHVCAKAKQVRPAISQGPAMQLSTPLHTLHSNICSPIDTTMHSGKRYFSTVINDCTCHTTVYLLTNKSNINKAIQWYLNSMAPLGQCCVLHTDQGGKYMSCAFQNFLTSKGIQHEATPLHTPKYNSIAKQFN
jgi:hypothetical protein